MGALHRHSTTTASKWLYWPYWLYWYRHRTALPVNAAAITNATPTARLVSVNRRNSKASKASKRPVWCQ